MKKIVNINELKTQFTIELENLNSEMVEKEEIMLKEYNEKKEEVSSQIETASIEIENWKKEIKSSKKP